MKQPLYCGRGTHLPCNEVMDLLNLSFNFTDPEHQFLGLLPKCYREEYRPQDSNYVVVDEDGVLAAAVGAYDHELTVCGRRIPCRGIGNVAVHPDHRKKGYMKLAMNKSLEDMVADGIALSTLGGRRQRYQYFGYDKAGPLYSFDFSPHNLHHLFNDAPARYEVKVITDPADPLIDDILTLNDQNIVVPIRPRETYLDIANSWHGKLLALTDENGFAGYCIQVYGNTISEIRVVRDEIFMDCLRAIYDYIGGSFRVDVPPYQAAYVNALAPVAESLSLGVAMFFNVLDYRLVIEAFLALKLTYTSIPDGSISLLIHGYARDERLRLTVRNGQPLVTIIPASEPVDYELSHLDAITFLFSPFSPIRASASPLAKNWFPLPICMYRADEV